MHPQLITARLVWDAKKEAYILDQVHVPDHIDPGLVSGFAPRVDFFHNHNRFATEHSVRQTEQALEDITDVTGLPFVADLTELRHNGQRLAVEPALTVTVDRDPTCQCGECILVKLDGFPNLTYGLHWDPQKAAHMNVRAALKDVSGRVALAYLAAQDVLAVDVLNPDLARLAARVSPV
jgi:hypothetical protein